MLKAQPPSAIVGGTVTLSPHKALALWGARKHQLVAQLRLAGSRGVAVAAAAQGKSTMAGPVKMPEAYPYGIKTLTPGNYRGYSFCAGCV